MKPLVDADILLHELGWSGQFKDKDTGNEVLLRYSEVSELLHNKIKIICEDVDATEDPVFYISDSEWLSKKLKREFVPNFRYDIAKTKPYKGTRKNPKPFHFYNIIADLMGNYECVISKDGLEADDMMCIDQMRQKNTIICSRDKDLRICPGWHYSWECGGQKALMPVETDKIGWLEMHTIERIKEETGEVKVDKKVLGYGLSFFYYQMLVGDSADNIPGLKGVGQAAAWEALSDKNTEQELYETVRDMYKDVMGKDAKELFMEQANLLWLYQEEGVGYKLPKKGS